MWNNPSLVVSFVWEYHDWEILSLTAFSTENLNHTTGHFLLLSYSQQLRWPLNQLALTEHVELDESLVSLAVEETAVGATVDRPHRVQHQGIGGDVQAEPLLPAQNTHLSAHIVHQAALRHGEGERAEVIWSEHETGVGRSRTGTERHRPVN